MNEMFSDEVGSNAKFRPLEGAAIPPEHVDISLYNQMELFVLRNKIDAVLPPMNMTELNLEEEVVRQFMTVKALQGETLGNSNVEPNKKAAVVNACAAALQALAKLQIDLHSAERFKAIESLIIKHMKQMPEDIAKKFLNDYTNLVYAND